MASLVVMIEKRKVIKAKYGWGSLKIFATSSYIDIILEISGVRKSKDVTLAVNVDNECTINAVTLYLINQRYSSLQPIMASQTHHFFSFVQTNS